MEAATPRRTARAALSCWSWAKGTTSEATLVVHGKAGELHVRRPVRLGRREPSREKAERQQRRVPPLAQDGLHWRQPEPAAEIVERLAQRGVDKQRVAEPPEEPLGPA